jgi:3-keto-L-gulonate-6-phosphate decarboxylase
LIEEPDRYIPVFVEAGVSIVVAGSSVFGAPDPAQAVRRLRAKANRK